MSLIWVFSIVLFVFFTKEMSQENIVHPIVKLSSAFTNMNGECNNPRLEPYSCMKTKFLCDNVSNTWPIKECQ